MFSSRRMLSTPGLLFLKLFFSHNPRSLFISAASFCEEWRHLDVSFLKYFFYLLWCNSKESSSLFSFFFLIFKFDIVSPFEKFKRKVLIFFSPRYFSFDFMFWKKLFFFFFWFFNSIYRFLLKKFKVSIFFIEIYNKYTKYTITFCPFNWIYFYQFLELCAWITDGSDSMIFIQEY